MQERPFSRKRNEQRRFNYRKMAESGIKGQKELKRILESGMKGIFRIDYASDIFALPYLEREGYLLMGVIPIEIAPRRIIHRAIYQRAKNPNLREQFYDSIEQDFDRAC